MIGTVLLNCHSFSRVAATILVNGCRYYNTLSDCFVNSSTPNTTFIFLHGISFHTWQVDRASKYFFFYRSATFYTNIILHGNFVEIVGATVVTFDGSLEI